MKMAAENGCDHVMLYSYSSMRYSPESYMELLNQHLGTGVSIFALDKGDVFEQVFASMPESLRKRLG